MQHRTSVVVNDTDIHLLRVYGYDNFSEFIRDCIDGALADEAEICPTCGNLLNQRKLKAMELGRKLLTEKHSQMRIVEQEIKEDIKVRCWDIGQEAYRMVSKNEIEKHPDFFIIDEPTGGYEA